MLLNDIGYLLILGYFIWEIDALAYFYLGMHSVGITAAVVQTVALNRLDRDGMLTRKRPRKFKIRIRCLRTILIGLVLFIYIFVQSIIDGLFAYRPVLISILGIVCLAYAASGLTFKDKDENKEEKR